MIELFDEQRMVAEPLCIGFEEEVTLYSCIEGNMGRLWVDLYDEPTCAIAFVGDFYFIVGSYLEAEVEKIISLISEFGRSKFLIINSEDWDPLVKHLQLRFPETYKSISRYALKGKKEWFDQSMLREYAAAIEPEFHAVRIDDKIHPITQEQYWTADFCSNFISKEDFFKNGIGYVILKDGQIIAGASTYSYCEGRLEITIETKEEYRKKGLALACASKLILESLERDIFPRWDAANLASVALAEKLGYRYEREYTVYLI